MLGKIKRVLRPFRRLRGLKREENLRLREAQKGSVKPQIINLLANDICNSKCAMCNIWQQKLDFEISPAQLEQILKNPLFSEVRSVGITGGEPTMREDLPQLYEAACRSLPALKDMSIITNAIKDKDVIARVEAAWAILKAAGKGFSMMISVDGYGQVHDQQRGREGNFDSAMRVYWHFRKKNEFPVAIACTITKQNVWKVDELLEFMMREGIYGRFRVAEFINRLYNNDLEAQIRNFDSAERYHLAGFFLRLIREYETNERFQRTYWSIIEILTGGKRLIACYYQSKGIVLDSRGQIQYCAPKGQPLGSLLEADGYELYLKNLPQRKAIIEQHCSDCIHDYHYDLSYPELKAQYQRAWVNRLLLPEGMSKRAKSIKSWPFWGKKYGKNHILITGWYGTETVGDKAILAGIVSHYRRELGEGVRFVISAFYPFVTRRTLEELNMEAEVVATDSSDFIRAALQCGKTVMGGGPMMGIEALATPLAAFELAHAAGQETVIFGCGLGPLHQPRHLAWAQRMLQIATEVRLRDHNSVKWAKELAPAQKNIQYFGDPAYHYLRELSSSLGPISKEPILACFLRDWSKEYQGDLSDAEFEALKADFEARIAAEIKEAAATFGLKIHFYCMHTFVVGGDDRIFYRRFIREHFADTEVYLEEYPSSVAQVVGAMRKASYNLCMRFHSVLFAHTLDTNFFAIDYTRGGKIRGFLQDHEALNRMVGLEELAQGSDFSLSKAMSEI